MLTMKPSISSRLRAALYSVIAVCLGFTAALLICEAFFVAYYIVRDGGYVSVRDKLDGEKNTHIQELIQDGGTYASRLFPHPYLGWVYRDNSPSQTRCINNVGMYGTDYPFERDPRKFVILLTGGSVVDQLARGCHPNINYLEHVLNAYYQMGEREFKVLNGGMGAWKQPQQLILFSLFADVVDAVVTLDGFNEHYMVGHIWRLEHPANNFLDINPFLDSGYGKLIGVWLNGRIYQYTRSSRICRHSKLCYFASRTLRDAIRVSCEDQTGKANPQELTLSGMYSLPQDWSIEKRIVYDLYQYRKYVRMTDAIAKKMEVKAAHFVQPCPAIGKKLTDAEKRVVGDLSYADIYARMTRSLLDLKGEGIPVYSILNIFQEFEGTIYADHVHCFRDKKTGESPGYRIMAERMAEILAKQWGLKRR